MKHITILLLTCLCIVITSQAQNNIGINDDNSAAKASAMLDIYSTTKGLLIPRIGLTSTGTAAPVTTPETSLLIYNTATTGDVTPGYYYWNGSAKWVRLAASTDPFRSLNMVTKSANTTLLKTENMVVASGDITLTLPVVTSADDGLEMTIKNVGTYTDLVTVAPQSGKTIDAGTNSLLTRWRGRTYVARATNWIIKEEETHTDNHYDVSATGSFTTIAEVVAFLNVHMTGPSVVRFGGGTYPVASTISISFTYPITFEGLSYDETTISAAAGVSGTPLFSCATECSFKMISFSTAYSAAGNDAIRFTGSGKYHEVKDCTFTGFNKGIISTNNNELWIFETDFENCAVAGLEIAAGLASGGSIKLSECDFTNCLKGISLLSGVAEKVSILNSTFYNTPLGSDIGISYNSAGFTAFSSMFISNNSWNNSGTFISGFDFSRTDGRDANAFLVTNSGMEDERPHCKINVSNNTSLTTITSAGTYYKAIWTNAATSYTCKWTLANNKITYQPRHKMDAWAIITGNLKNDQTGKTITIAIVKNGVTTTRYGETDLRITTQNQSFQFSTVIYVSDMMPADYLELYCTSNNSGDNLTFQDIQWFTNTQ